MPIGKLKPRSQEEQAKALDNIDQLCQSLMKKLSRESQEHSANSDAIQVTRAVQALVAYLKSETTRVDAKIEAVETVNSQLADDVHELRRDLETSQQ